MISVNLLFDSMEGYILKVMNQSYGSKEGMMEAKSSSLSYNYLKIIDNFLKASFPLGDPEITGLENTDFEFLGS